MYWEIMWHRAGVEDITRYTSEADFVRALEQFRADEKVLFISCRKVEFWVERE